VQEAGGGARRLSGTATRGTRSSPYQGLAPFGAEDASFFFGREREREVVIANLRARRLTVIYGDSGVGKSSLLRAGVLSELQRQARDDLRERQPPEFIPVIFSAWSDDPMAGLRRAVRSAIADVLPEAVPEESDGGLVETLTAWAGALGCEFLIILDQFEEYFLYHGHEEGQGTLAFELPRALNDRDLPASFLLSIREDAFAKLDRFKTQVPSLLDNYLRVRHLDERAAREAIERPLEAWNNTVPEGERVQAGSALVDTVIKEVRASAGPGGGSAQGVVEGDGHVAEAARVEAPYLQLVLTRLWDEEMKTGSRRLRPETLRRLGGTRDIVQNHLDEAMSTLSPEEQELAAGAFYYLVTPEGTKIAQSLQTLSVYSGRSPEELEPVLEKLATSESRILRPVAPPPGIAGGTRYEIFHDVLASPVLDWRNRHERTTLEKARIEAERRRDEALAAVERRRRGALLALGLGILAFALTLYATDALDSVELKTVDARFDVRGKASAPRDMAVVVIDNRTLSDLRAGYPLPRAAHARLVDLLRRAGARLIVYDLEFFGQKPEDDRLLAAIDRARPVVLGAILTTAAGGTLLFGNDVVAKEIGARVGSLVLPPDEVVRKVSYTANRLPSLAVVAAETLEQRRIDPSELGDGDMWVDYAGPPGTIPPVSFSQVLSGAVPADRFKDKVVVIGNTSLGRDQHRTSMGDGSMPGAEIQANAIDTVRRLAPLRSWGGAGPVLVIIVFALLAPLLALRLRPLVVAAVPILVLVMYLVAAQVAFEDGHIWPVTYPLFALIAGTIGALLIGVAFRIRTPERDEHRIVEPNLP
jgi:CHASE2 domain-containing sensor protein